MYIIPIFIALYIRNGVEGGGENVELSRGAGVGWAGACLEGSAQSSGSHSEYKSHNQQGLLGHHEFLRTSQILQLGNGSKKVWKK